jgi:integrase
MVLVGLLVTWKMGMPLSDTACRGFKPGPKPVKRSDAGGLYLLIKPSGSKLWQMAYRFGGKQKTLSFGPYPITTLAEARARRDDAKRKLAEGVDPGAKVAAAPVDKSRWFRTVAVEWFETQVRPSRKPEYAARVWSRVEADLLPPLGERAIDDIEPIDVLTALRAIQGRGAVHSARRIGLYASGIFRYARVAHGLRHNPAEGLGGALMPAPAKVGQPSLPPTEVPAFFSALGKPHRDEPLTRIALELAMRTVLRSSELRFARWAEVKGDEWHVPAERMKMRRPHVVPLSRQAQELVERLRAITGGSVMMFPGRRPGHVMSENTMLFAIYGLGFKGRSSVHGWRATFSTWAHESGRWPSEWIETCLAHVDSNAVRAAYNRTTWLPQRREIMQAWSDWLDAQREICDLLG